MIRIENDEPSEDQHNKGSIADGDTPLVATHRASLLFASKKPQNLLTRKGAGDTIGLCQKE